MKNIHIQILIFLCFAALLLPAMASAQEASKITIESVVKDEKGNPVVGATIYGNEGAAVVKTDFSGKFTISIPEKSDLMIESDGYEPAVFKKGEIKDRKVFSLKSSVFNYGTKDVVNVAFGKIKKGDVTNAVSVINPAEVFKYDNNQDVYAALNGNVPGLLGSSNIRGIGTPLFIVDGLPRDISAVDLTEVEQISVLKDINASMLYGNDAVNGVVLITTKRGEAYKKKVNVSAYYGISTPKALPKYLPSADYMELYNEARLNDGLAPLYSEPTIDNYRYGNPYQYPSVDYYSKDYVKSYKPYSKVLTELSGGNDITKYYANIGWEETGSIMNFGEGKNGKEDKFNIRGNVDMKVNSWIKNALDAAFVLDNTKGALGSYWSEAATRHPDLYSPLLPISLIDPNNTLLKGRKNDVDGLYLLGGTSSYQTNAFAYGYSGGQTTNSQRRFSVNDRIDFDLDRLVKGLAFHTNISFDFYTSFAQSVNNSYSVYLPTWNAAGDSIIALKQFGTDTRTGTQNVTNGNYQRRFGFYGMFDYDRTFGDVHHVSGTLLGYGNNYKVQGDFQGDKNVNLGLRLNYAYDKKYLVDFSSAYVNSAKLPEGKRGAFSPSLGLAWVISSEDFMSEASAVNYLKLKVSGGVMNSDYGIGGFYLYDNSYNTSGSYSWYEGTWSNSGVVSTHGANSGLGYEKRKELNLGLEAILFDHQLSVDANVFTSVYSDQITQPQTKYPSFYTSFIPYENFDSNSYKGAELGLSYNKTIGDFSFTVGANALYATSKILKKDEVWSNDYQYRVGHTTDARYGLVAEGLFSDQEDIDNHALQAFGEVKPGDIKYVDQNNDGIVDSNDEIQIGRWQSPFSYGLNMRLSYKNMTLFAQGTGAMGADGYISNDYYWVDGNDKYSEYILNRWTEATKTTATLPRLTSLSSTNNYRSSTFWLYKDNYFNLNRVQFTYDLPENVAKFFKMKNLNLFVNGSNLLTISKYRNIKELSVGAEPYYRSFSLGVKTMF